MKKISVIVVCALLAGVVSQGVRAQYDSYWDFYNKHERKIKTACCLAVGTGLYMALRTPNPEMLKAARALTNSVAKDVPSHYSLSLKKASFAGMLTPEYMKQVKSQHENLFRRAKYPWNSDVKLSQEIQDINNLYNRVEFDKELVRLEKQYKNAYAWCHAIEHKKPGQSDIDLMREYHKPYKNVEYPLLEAKSHIAKNQQYLTEVKDWISKNSDKVLVDDIRLIDALLQILEKTKRNLEQNIDYNKELQTYQASYARRSDTDYIPVLVTAAEAAYQPGGDCYEGGSDGGYDCGGDCGGGD